MDLLNEGDGTTTTGGETPSRPPSTLSAEELMDAVEESDTYHQLPSRSRRWLERLAEELLDVESPRDAGERGENGAGWTPAEMQVDEWSTEVTAAQNAAVWFEEMTPDHRSAWAKEMLRVARKLPISADPDTKRWLKGIILRKEPIARGKQQYATREPSEHGVLSHAEPSKCRFLSPINDGAHAYK